MPGFGHRLRNGKTFQSQPLQVKGQGFREVALDFGAHLACRDTAGYIWRISGPGMIGPLVDDKILSFMAFSPW